MRVTVRATWICPVSVAHPRSAQVRWRVLVTSPRYRNSAYGRRTSGPAHHEQSRGAERASWLAFERHAIDVYLLGRSPRAARAGDTSHAPGQDPRIARRDSRRAPMVARTADGS